MGPAAASVLTALVVALAVAMVNIGGGLNRPLVTSAPHAAPATASRS
jgi:hypothetical protein